MPRKNIVFMVVLVLLTSVLQNHASQRCRIDSYSIYQMMLKGHTFKTFKAQAGSLDCRHACLADIRCQSYNVVIFENLCELNNRSKEARPEDFIKSENRYHFGKVSERGIETKSIMFSLTGAHFGNCCRILADNSKTHTKCIDLLRYRLW